MSVVIANGGTQALNRVSDIVPANSDYTAILWVKLTNSAGAFYRNYFTQLDSAASYLEWAGLFSQGAQQNAYVGVEGGSGFHNTIPSGTMTIGQWYPMAYVRSGNNQSFYFNFALVETIVEDITADNFTEQWLGNDTGSNGAHNIKGFREWNKAITSLSALTTEWLSPTAVDTVNLWADTPLVSDGNDVSGNGRHWLPVNAPSYVNDLNFITDATLPDTFTLTPTDDGDVFDFYYLADETKVIGAFAGVSSPSGNYSPRTEVTYFDSGSWTIVNALSGNAQRPIIIPTVDGNIYWIHVFNVAANPPGRDVVITFVDGPDNVPVDVAGLIFISEDQATFDFPVSSLLDINTGEVLKEIRTVTSSENGAVSPVSGNVMLTGDNSPNLGKVSFYTGDGVFTPISVDSTTIAGAGQITPPASASDNFFYVARYLSGPAVIRVWRWDPDGVLDATTWDIPLPTGWTDNRVGSIAVSKDDSKLYYSYSPSTAPNSDTNVIKVWDLVNDVALPDLVTTNTNYRNRDIQYSSDNFIYVGGSDRIATLDAVIWKYDPTGDLELTIQLDNAKGFLDHFTLGHTDTVYLVTWQHLDPDPNDSARSLFNFSTWNVSTGANILSEDGFRDFTGQVGPLVDFGSTPPEDFGPGNSCPLIVLLGEAPPPPVNNPLSGIYKIIPGSQKPNDTLWTNLETLETTDFAIPNPFIEGPGIGS